MLCSCDFWHHAKKNSISILKLYPDSKVHGANMGPTWVLSAPDGPYVGPIHLALRIFKTDWLENKDNSLPSFWLLPWNLTYRETSNISRTLVGNKIADNSDVVGASPVGAAPTTSSISALHLA